MTKMKTYFDESWTEAQLLEQLPEPEDVFLEVTQPPRLKLSIAAEADLEADLEAEAGSAGKQK